MKAIGWSPVVRGRNSQERVYGVTGWADEEWQRRVFRDDFRAIVGKAAAGWVKWCKKFEKNPEKALRK